MSQPSLLVTGGSGFIGLHLIEELGKENKLTVLSRGPRPSSINRSVNWQVGSLLDKALVTEHVKKTERIIHLASLSSNQAQSSPDEDFKVSVLGTRWMLEAASRYKIKKFVYTSSAQVYEGNSDHPLTETNVCKPTSVYGMDKYIAEQMVQVYSQQFNINSTILRLFNVYGDDLGGRPRPTVETIFLDQLLAGKTPVIHNNPDDGRDFVHISDVVRAIKLALFSPKSGLYNVGTGRLTTMADLADILTKLTNSPVKVKETMTEKKPSQLLADTKLSSRELGFTAKVGLEAGLSQMISRRKAGRIN
jgi:UDP-glucose 4-epimerase